MPARERPLRPRRPRGRWMALALAIAVNAVFLGVLIFSVSWQNRAPVPVVAEIYAAPSKPAPAEPPRPEPKAEPKPVPEPPPEPRVEPPPKPEPPAPKVEPPPPKPPPPAEKPAPPDPSIALKAKAEAERRERERIEQERQRREAEAKRAEEKRAEEKRQADLRERQERQERELAAMRAQAEREAQQRKAAERQAEREKQMLAMAEAESRERAKQAAAAAANQKALADWSDRIRAKVRSNVIEPPELAGNPEAVFVVVLLPTGEVIDVQLRKSSGLRAYDDAVSRAILKSSPLPRPERPEVFQRTLELRFRPRD